MKLCKKRGVMLTKSQKKNLRLRGVIGESRKEIKIPSLKQPHSDYYYTRATKVTQGEPKDKTRTREITGRGEGCQTEKIELRK